MTERAAVATVVLLVAAALGWVVVPTAGGAHGAAATPSANAGRNAGVASQSGGASVSSPGPARAGLSSPNAAGGRPSVSSVGGGNSGNAHAVSVGGAPSHAVSSSAGGGCVPPPGSAPGVSATQVRIAVTLTDIVGPAANSTFGLPSAGEQQADYQEVIDAINRSGGVACRQLVPQFSTVNAADQSDQQQKCLDIAQEGVFAELDFTAYATVGGACFAQHHIPFFINYFLAKTDTTEFYPYQFALNTYDDLYHNAIFALKARGFFDPKNGFRKLGFIYRDCFPQVPIEMMSWLREVGIPVSDIVTYNVGCPSAFASPSDLEQAVLKFQQNRVTNVTTGYFLGDFANFTTIAQQQGFRPKYGIGDDGTVNISYGSQHPNYANIANAIAVTASSYGEEHTPGMTPSPGTARCNAIYQLHRRAPVYQQPIGAGGDICDELWMFAAALDHAPTLSQTSLAAGLQAARSVEFSYPQGPNDFTGDRVTTGGQYWRTDQFLTSCNCWRVIDPTFHPSV